jgi:hypothetical protein
MAAFSPLRRKMFFPSFHAENEDQGTKLEPPLAKVARMPSASKETVPDLALAALAAFSKAAFQRNQDSQSPIRNTGLSD